MTFWKNGGTKQWLEWLLPLYVFLLPWQARYIVAPFSAGLPRYGDWSVYATDFLFLLVVGLWFFYIRRQREQLRTDWQALRWPLIGALIFFAYALSSLLWTPHWVVGREQLYRLAQALLTAMMLASGVVSRQRLLIALTASGAAQGLLAVAQFFTQSIPASTWLGVAAQNPQNLGVSVVEYGDQRWLRAYGSLPHPNILGAFSGLAMVSAAQLFWSARETLNRRLDLLAWIGFIFSFFALLFSFSRSAWLATAVALIVLVKGQWLVSKREERHILLILTAKLAGAMLLFLLFFSALFGPLWWQRGHDQSDLAQRSSTDRAALAAQSDQLAAEHRLIGSGVGSYLPLLTRAYPDQPVFFYQPAHNVWRMMLVELGYPGIIIALVTILLIARTIWQQRNVLAASMFVFLLVAINFEHFWYSLPVGLLMIALAVALPFAKAHKT